MTRRLALAWCAGATVGLVVGALLGDAVRTDAELRAARRTARRLGAAGASSGRSETPGAGYGPQALGLAALAHDPAWWSASIETPDSYFTPLEEVAAEFGIDLSEPDDSEARP